MSYVFSNHILVLHIIRDSLALDFNEYNAAWRSIGNSRSGGR